MPEQRVYPEKPDRIYFFGTCIIDLLYPESGLAGMQLISANPLSKSVCKRSFRIFFLSCRLLVRSRLIIKKNSRVFALFRFYHEAHEGREAKNLKVL